MPSFNEINGGGVFGMPGVEPTKAYPFPTTSGSGVNYPPMRLGTVTKGSEGTEWLLCKLTIAAITDLLPGQAYGVDRDFNATLLTTANSVLGQEVGYCQVFQPNIAIGTYYVWLGVRGHMAMRTNGAVTGYAETYTTAGVTNFAATPTAGGKSISQVAINTTSYSFTGTFTNGSSLITGVTPGNGVNIGDAMLGASLVAGGPIPANTAIGSITKTGSTLTIGMVGAAYGSFATPVNATSSTTATFSANGTNAGIVILPALVKQN